MTRKWAQPEIDINTQRVLNAEEQTKVSQLEALAKNMDIKIQWNMSHPDPEETKNIPGEFAS